MSTTDNETMRVIAYREGDVWIAQCIEHDIASQGCDFETAMRRLVGTIGAECRYTLAKHGEEFAGIGPAPAIYAEMFDAAHQPLRFDNVELRIAA